MAKNPQTKDDALEALDFIVNVLKEHEKDLDKLINELATVTEQIGENEALNGKIENVEDKINKLQTEVTNLIGYLSSPAKETLPVIVKKTTSQVQVAQAALSTGTAGVQSGPSMIVRCKQWEDFQSLAFHAQTLSFSYKEDEKVFQVDALKGNQIISYAGPFRSFLFL